MGAKLAGAPPLWQGPPARTEASTGPGSRRPSRRSSVVEHVIGNDGVSSSILLGGTSYFNGLANIPLLGPLCQ
jgi:hypothetical protein